MIPSLIPISIIFSQCLFKTLPLSWLFPFQQISFLFIGKHILRLCVSVCLPPSLVSDKYLQRVEGTLWCPLAPLPFSLLNNLSNMLPPLIPLLLRWVSHVFLPTFLTILTHLLQVWLKSSVLLPL